MKLAKQVKLLIESSIDKNAMLDKALADIEMQFGGKNNKREKGGLSDFYHQGSSTFWQRLKSGLKIFKSGPEYHLSKEELQKSVGDQYEISDKDFNEYEAMAKKTMDGIHKRYEIKGEPEWEKLDRLYKMMPEYRKRYL